MFRFFKKKITGEQLGRDYFSYLKDKHLVGHPEGDGVYPLDAEIGADLVKIEWLYFRVFAFDYAVFLALGKTQEKNAVLAPFWDGMRSWLQAVPVPSLPERLLVVGGPRTIPTESAEMSYARLQRRAKEYAVAITTPHHMGENWSVAGTFAGFCGEGRASVIAGVSAFFSVEKIETVKIIRSFRIVG